MSPDLLLAKNVVYDRYGLLFSDLAEENESKEYNASTFSLDHRPVKFRTAKITPTKTGQFVTLWKRNASGITAPHRDSDLFDLYIIHVRKEALSGQFVFSRSALIKQGILSSATREGKRGFRVYPPWDVADNRQAQKTQEWQLEFFLEIKDGSTLDPERIARLFCR